MISSKTLLAGFSIACTCLLGAAYGADKTYQVTGPVTELTDTKIVVEKNNELWAVARTPATPVSGGDLKVGEKVTVTYTMTATDIEVKGAKKPAKDEKKKDQK